MADYAFDPELEKILPHLPTWSDFSDVEKVRKIRKANGELFVTAPDRDDVSKEDRTVPGPQGNPDLPIRIYRPTADANGLRAGVYEIHGGGFMMGSIDMTIFRVVFRASSRAALPVSTSVEAVAVAMGAVSSRRALR